MGSLFIDENDWKIVAPTEIGKQAWGVGGEIAIWQSVDKGKSWKKIKTVTQNSPLSHSYIRRIENGKAPFQFFWANGHSHEFSRSELFFGDFSGKVWRLPYEMEEEWKQPAELKN
ncbi:MAG: hypothetical protein AAGI23_13880 [Bacteroidota bacterium]